MTGTYTSPKRVERDGRLVAFEGEVMTMDEAVQRGLVKAEKPKKAPAKGKPAAEAKGKPEEEAKEGEPEEEAKEA